MDPTFPPTPAGDRARARDWIAMAARPGSGIGFLGAALTVQPLTTVVTLGLAAAFAAARTLRVSPRR